MTRLLLLIALVGCPKAAPVPEAPPVEAPAYVRPQTPAAPFPYTTERLTWQGAGVTLGGTLTVPEGDGPFPAVLLITGSGPQDRDETIAEHRPFAVLADQLARQGVASLRADDRGVGESTGVLVEATYDQLVDDVLSGVSLLEARPKVSASKIGLLGHSEGGTIAALAASKSEKVQYVVMMAAPGVKGRTLLLDQAEAILATTGVPHDRLATHRMAHAQALDALDKDPATLRSAFKKLVSIQVDIAEHYLKQPRPADLNPIVDAAIGTVNTPWFSQLVKYDPAPTLASVDVPVLVLNGSLDLQVLPDPNLDAIRGALDHNDDALVMEFPGLNHLFQHAKRGTMDEYGLIEETMAPEVIQTVGEWVAER